MSTDQLTEEQQETRHLITDTAAKIFTDHCDKELLDAAEQGHFPAELWQLIQANGFHQLGTAESGTNAGDMFAFLQVCGRFSVPLPIAETLLVNRWVGAADDLASVGHIDDQGSLARQVTWGRNVARVVAISQQSNEIVLSLEPQVEQQSRNLAGEPVHVIALNDTQRITLDQPPYAQMALARANLLAGNLQSQLDLGVLFATERKQFGRSISKFQAIQHSLAVIAAEVAASQRAADAAADALGDERFISEVAVAKARVGEAAGVVAEQVHQIHGAMGFTYEHRLHHFTRRAWTWRDEWGHEVYWQAVLGRDLCQLGADQVWNFVATAR